MSLSKRAKGVITKEAGAIRERVASELATLCKEHGGLRPERIHGWAKSHKDSAIHGRLQWDDSKAGYQYRLWQIRQLIVEVRVIYPDNKPRQVYVSPVKERGKDGTGYQPLVDVMSDEEKRAAFLMQALAEYKRVGEKYKDLQELAGVRAAVARVNDRIARVATGAKKAA